MDAMPDELGGKAEMILATCNVCRSTLRWEDCRTGGWWSHDVRPSDDHEGAAGWQPAEEMDDGGWLYTVEPVEYVHV